MQEASFTGFIKTLFYIVAFYYIFRFLAKLFLPLLIKKVVEKAGENMQQQQRQYQDFQQNTREGETSIYTTQNVKQSRETKKVGDYVDYEEID